MVLPQLYSDLAHLGWVLTLVNYLPCEILFGPDLGHGFAVGRGRPRYPRIPIVKGFLVAYILDIKGRQVIVDKLRNHPALRAVCGWPAGVQVPHRSTVSRVFGELAANPWVVHYMLVDLVKAAHELRPDFGKVLAIDSTGVAAYCNPNNETTRDQEAAWGRVHDPRSKEPDGMVWVYRLESARPGGRAHAIADSVRCFTGQ